MTLAVRADRVDAVRAFNRFYTTVIGVLQDGLLGSPYSLTEVRVMFELAHGDATDVADLRRLLGIDAGYLSRLLARFADDGLIVRERSTSDGRRQVITLTDRGRAVFAPLNDRSAAQVRDLLGRLTDAEQQQLTAAMATIQDCLGERPRPRTVVLRAPRPGEFGWVVARNGALYAQEHGWDESYEALVARIMAECLDNYDPRRDAAWIAEVDGAPVGAIFCVHHDDTTAKLRLLHVEPSARGLGIGARLITECVEFARRAGYARIILWTVSVLEPAHRLYQRAGFTLVNEVEVTKFGHRLTSQDWTLDL